MSDIQSATPDHLWRNFEMILELIPNKDAELEFPDFDNEFFASLGPSIGPHELVLMQLGGHNSQLNYAFRTGAAKMLQNSSIELNMATRVFISEMITTTPITKINSQSTLVRDIFIIWAIMILDRFGYTPTSGAETHSEKPSGCFVLFEYLVLKRGLTFADNEKTIQKIWSKRVARFEQIGLKHLL